MPACAVSGALGQPARCPGGNRQFPSQIKAPKLSRTESPHGCNSPKVPPHTHQPPAPPQPPGSHASLVLHRPRAPRGTQVPPPPCTPPGASRPRWYPWRSLPPGQGCRSIPRTPTRAPSAPRLTAAPRCPGVEWQWERAAGRRRGLSLPLEQHRERAGKREKKAEEGKEAGEEKKKIKKKRKDKPANPSPFSRARAQLLGWAVGPWPALPPAPASSSSSSARPQNTPGHPAKSCPSPEAESPAPMPAGGWSQMATPPWPQHFPSVGETEGTLQEGGTQKPCAGTEGSPSALAGSQECPLSGLRVWEGSRERSQPTSPGLPGGAPHPGVLSAGGVCPAPVAGASGGPKRIERGGGGWGVVSNSLQTRHPPVNITRLQTC